MELYDNLCKKLGGGEMNKILNVVEVAETFKTSRSTIYRELKEGLPFITVGKEKRFIFEEVLEYFKNKK